MSMIAVGEKLDQYAKTLGTTRRVTGKYKNPDGTDTDVEIFESDNELRERLKIILKKGYSLEPKDSPIEPSIEDIMAEQIANKLQAKQILKAIEEL